MRRIGVGVGITFAPWCALGESEALWISSTINTQHSTINDQRSMISNQRSTTSDQPSDADPPSSPLRGFQQISQNSCLGRVGSYIFYPAPLQLACCLLYRSLGATLRRSSIFCGF